MPKPQEELDKQSLARYTDAAIRASREVIATYSTSFGWATKLLKQPIRTRFRTYGLVRVADEIVDGAAAGALGDNRLEATSQLDKLEQETYKAMQLGFSTNLIVHAFAVTARDTGIDRKHIEAFYHSMRMDLNKTRYDHKSFSTYVYGSAEVIGLMCLQTFIHDKDFNNQERETLRLGAQALGAAFQKVNFLRDLAADFEQLGRSYFPLVNVNNFNEETKVALVTDIQNDLAVSAKSIKLIPKSARKAVVAAQLLFTELNDKISQTPAEELIRTRIRVSNPRKLVIILKALLGVSPK
ncbi:MAG: phytoene/squalene synthase family protein [Actinobacteria bacterium]|nr:phytoene/squalene synthase family protein [Actinomycetota bacterium]